MLLHTPTKVEPAVQRHIDVCTQQKIAPRGMYACLRDELLNSDVAYCPTSYLNALTPAQEFLTKPKKLAQTMRKLARKFKIFRRRVALRSFRFPELSVIL